VECEAPFVTPAASLVYSLFFGLLFGLGTMTMLAIIGVLSGVSLRWSHALTGDEVRRIGSQTWGRTLFCGGRFLGIERASSAAYSLSVGRCH
jgi:hypothetical protein